MLFGKEKDQGLRIRPNSLRLEAVTLGKDGISESDILVHDETDRTLATMLAGMDSPDLPVALGVLYCDSATTYEDGLESLAAETARSAKVADMNALLRTGHTWTVE